VDDKKSTSGTCFCLGSIMISWISMKQNFVALKITEAEYIGALDACTKGIWLRKLIYRLFDWVSDLIMIFCDNQSCVNIS
jgi:hypothetical protein